MTPPTPPDEDRDTETQKDSGSSRQTLLVSDRSGVRSIELPSSGSLLVGRSPECDVVLDDEAASRRHAIVRLAGRVATVEDLSSRNGTLVGGRRAPGSAPQTLGLGVLVEIGATTLVLFRQPSETGAGVPPRRASAVRVRSPTAAVVSDPTMRRLYAMLDVVGPSSLPLIVLGETGTGKEVFARAVHAASSRASAPFVAVNCAALPEQLLESELFGHERGAFTGASAMKVGLIEAASGGTLFLDEVGELDLSVQAKLLRVLETREIRRLGATRSVQVDVRYVAATNRDLQAAVLSNEFRSDLFFRLNGFAFVLPPLRDRRGDVSELAAHFAEQLGAGPLSEQVCEALLGHDWPGNVRELRMVIERAAALARGGAIEVSHLMLGPALPAPALPPRAAGAATLPPPSAFPADGLEKDRIVEALRQTSGNQKEAARLLGIARKTLIKKIERHGLGRPRKARAE